MQGNFDGWTSRTSDCHGKNDRAQTHIVLIITPAGQQGSQTFDRKNSNEIRRIEGRKLLVLEQDSTQPQL